MPEAILGLDIGEGAVKAVLAIPENRADVRLLALETVRLTGEVDLEAAIKSIAESIRTVAPSGYRTIVCLPPSDVMFRHISLPFRDENRIRKTLYFELEPLLPVPVEEVVADHLPLPDDGLLAAAVEKVKIRQILTAVETHLAPVAVVDIAPAVLALPLLEQKALTGSGLVLDVGASSTCAVFYEKNALTQIRSFAFGGDMITGALAQDLSCGSEEAEQIKINAAYGVKNDRALAACREFCVSLANTVEFMRINETLHDAPDRIFLTGGGSLFKELGEELGRTFGLPVEALDSARFGRMEIDETLRERFLPPVMSTALAAVKRAVASRRSFNFRKGEFAAGNIGGDLRKQLRWGAVVTAVIFVLAAADLILDYSLQARQAADLKNSISQIFKKHFPPSTVMVDPVSQLQKKLAEDKKLFGMEDGGPGVTAVELLKEISALISPAFDVVLTHMHYENNIILLKGEAKKVDDVTRVKNELLKSKTFRNVTIGQTALAQDGTRVNFDLRIELK